MPQYFPEENALRWGPTCARRSVNLRTSMTDHERETLTTLCARISYEKNPAVFLELLIELEALLNKAGWPKRDA